MASTSQDKLQEVERAFQDRINHYYSDMGAADAHQAVIIDQQYHDAEAAYNLALQKAFLGNSAQIEGVTADLKTANDAVDQLRAQDEEIANILNAAGQAIDLAKTLTLLAG